MRTPWVITPRGKLYSRAFYDQQSFWADLRDIVKIIDSWKINETRMIMSQSEWDDILKYSQGDKE
jgi:hypothetical protein